MIKRTLHVGNPAHLSVHKSQLRISYPDDRPDAHVPIEDIGMLVLEDHRITLSHALISRMLGHNVAIVTCDGHHLPQGMMLNLNAHSEQQEHFRVQLAATEAQKARFWQQTVRAKIRNQATLLAANGLETENMQRWANKTTAGDPDNFEARAAAWYWQKLFVDLLSGFRRGRFEAPPNNLLNYGYAILRAVVARSLIGSGLLPTVGYHHHNKYNAYCLADDVMEPYRPFVDQLVLELIRDTADYEQLTPTVKQQLLQIPVLDVKMDGQTRPLMLAAQQTSSSLYKCYARQEKTITFPEL